MRSTGRPHLDLIREQFEAEDAENKRKLDRLNGCAIHHCPSPGPSACTDVTAHPCRHSRIAELSDGKRALWSMLSMQQQKQKSTERVDVGQADAPGQPAAAAAAASTHPEGSIDAREEALARAELSLAERKQDHYEAVALREVKLQERETLLQQAEDRMATKEATASQMLASAAREQAELRAAAAAAAERDARLAEREATLLQAEAALTKVCIHILYIYIYICIYIYIGVCV